MPVWNSQIKRHPFAIANDCQRKVIKSLIGGVGCRLPSDLPEATLPLKPLYLATRAALK